MVYIILIIYYIIHVHTYIYIIYYILYSSNISLPSPFPPHSLYNSSSVYIHLFFFPSPILNHSHSPSFPPHLLSSSFISYSSIKRIHLIFLSYSSQPLPSSIFCSSVLSFQSSPNILLSSFSPFKSFPIFCSSILLIPHSLPHLLQSSSYKRNPSI